MKQLSGTDTMFLSMETASMYGHVSGLAVFDPPTDGRSPYELVSSRIEAMLGDVPLFRRRVVEVPFGAARPYWIEDPDFDLDNHIHHIGVPPPGTYEQLYTLVADLVARHLDRRRPLWDAWVIEGLADGRWASLTRTHHAAIDGAGGVVLMNIYYSTEPTTEPFTGSEPPPGERVPTPEELLARTAIKMAFAPQRMAALQVKLITETLQRGTEGWGDAARRARSRPVLAPPTPFNQSIGPSRKLAFGRIPLADLKEAKNAFGCTINDVVMALCGGALRAYLDEKGALPKRDLVAGVPVSIRTGDEEDPWTNRVWSLVCPIPTSEEDPVERIARARNAMTEAKADLDLVPAETLADFAQFQSPGVAASAARVMTRRRAGDRMRQAINLIVSNVPGPRTPLYLGTAQMVRYQPISTIAEGQGLNITVHSYLDSLDIGLMADKDLMPDLERLVQLMEAEMEVLLEAAREADADTEDDAEEQSDEPPLVDRSNWTDELDPAARQVLELTAQAIENGQPPTWKMTPVEARESYATLSGMMGPGDAVHHVEDLTAPGPSGDVPVRLYRPADGILPVYVYYHGGGFVIGGIDTHDRECRRIANEAGCVVISVDYGLGPEAPFPAATDDAWAALCWVRDRAEAFGLDVSRIAVGGDSAGGNIAAVTALRARDEGIELKLQTLIYPAVDIADGVDDRYPSRKAYDGIVLSTPLNEWFMRHYLGDDFPDDPRLTPIRQELAGVAPALVITAGCDPLRDESKAYADALDEAGVPTTYSDYPGQIHGFFNLGPAIPDGWNAVSEVAQALVAAFSQEDDHAGD